MGHQFEQRLEQIEVRGDTVLDAGSQHLHRHLTPVLQSGLVDHRDRGPPDGLGHDLGEDVPYRHPEVGLDSAPDLGEGHHGAGVQTGAELVRQLVPEHPGSRGDELAELHVGATEILEGLPERPGQLGHAQRAAARPTELAKRVAAEVPGGDEPDRDAPAQELAPGRPGKTPRVDTRNASRRHDRLALGVVSSIGTRLRRRLFRPDSVP